MPKPPVISVIAPKLTEAKPAPNNKSMTLPASPPTRRWIWRGNPPFSKVSAHARDQSIAQPLIPNTVANPLESPPASHTHVSTVFGHAAVVNPAHDTRLPPAVIENPVVASDMAISSDEELATDNPVISPDDVDLATMPDFEPYGCELSDSDPELIGVNNFKKLQTVSQRELKSASDNTLSKPSSSILAPMTGCIGNDPAAHAESVESAAASTQECSETMHSYYGSKSNKLCNLVPLSTLIEGETWEWAQAPREEEEPEERVAKRVWSSRTNDLLETAVLPDDVSTAASNQSSMLWCGLNTVDTLAGRFTSNSMGRIDMQQSTEENTAT